MSLIPWKPASWKKLPAYQQPIYPDNAITNKVLQQLANYKELRTIADISQLNQLLTQVVAKKAIILQAGDCAESFAGFSKDKIFKFASLLTQMQAIISAKQNIQVIKLGRIAGQFAKPRTKNSEITAKGELPIYRGDIINSSIETIKARIPDPKRMLHAYKQAQQTIIELNSTTQQEKDHLNFNCHKVYTSHEALLLPYEQALIRKHKKTGFWYSSAADSLWIGKRTLDYKAAHIEFVRGIINPIGMKISHDMTKNELINLINIVNPYNIPNKIMLIIRMGKHLNTKLPKLITAIKQEKKAVLWLSDPMHANIYQTTTGYKTRHIDDIYTEISSFINIMVDHGQYPAGLHLEISPLDVTECIDDTDITEQCLKKNYRTLCDPRLNRKQALAVSKFFINLLTAKKVFPTDKHPDLKFGVSNLVNL